VIEKIDTFLLERADDYLDFCLEWLGLTKRQVVLTHFYIATIAIIVGVIIDRFFVGAIFVVVLMSFVGFTLHMLIPSYDRSERLLFSSMMAVLAIVNLMPPHKHIVSDLLGVLFNVSFIAIYYICSSNHDGERGKKVKMAWSKIKELFGMEWQVEPLKIPN
jgi:hypothetical protein